MRVVALDFDGVISDSAPESYLTALRTWTDLHPASRLGRELESLDGVGAALGSEHIQATRLYRDFVELMPLGNRAEDFGVVLNVLEVGIAVPDQQAYDEQRDALGAELLQRFHRRFYELRERFARERPAQWRALLVPYGPFVEILHRRREDAILAIATAKDRPSVDRLLASYGIEELFPASFVLDKETGVSKRAHLEELAKRTGAGFGEIVFVDDKVNHLEDVASLGVHPALAAWGYNGERERERARACGFRVLELESAEQRLFDEPLPARGASG